MPVLLGVAYACGGSGGVDREPPLVLYARCHKKFEYKENNLLKKEEMILKRCFKNRKWFYKKRDCLLK